MILVNIVYERVHCTPYMTLFEWTNKKVECFFGFVFYVVTELSLSVYTHLQNIMQKASAYKLQFLFLFFWFFFFIQSVLCHTWVACQPSCYIDHIKLSSSNNNNHNINTSYIVYWYLWLQTTNKQCQQKWTANEQSLWLSIFWRTLIEIVKQVAKLYFIHSDVCVYILYSNKQVKFSLIIKLIFC